LSRKDYGKKCGSPIGEPQVKKAHPRKDGSWQKDIIALPIAEN